MGSVIEIETGRSGYRALLDHVLKNGKSRNPRDIPTLDAGWTTIVVNDPSEMLPVAVGRKLNPAIAAAEALQLIGGFSDPGLMFRIAPQFMKYAEMDTFRFHGAYGERIARGPHGHQLVDVWQKLTADPNTRQAVITLWDPELDNNTFPTPRDIPCTCALHFAIIDGCLDMNVMMRSSDVWRGIPYDFFQFGQVQHTLAHVLAVPVGTYRHTSYSFHLYESDLDLVENVTAPTATGPFQPRGVAHQFDTMFSVLQRARTLTYANVPSPNDSEQWYHRSLGR